MSFASGPGQSFAFSVFQPAILAETNLTATRFSLIYALGSGFSALVVFVLGRGLDRFGVRSTTFVLAALLFAGSLGMAFAGGFLSLLVALALLRAIGQGCLPTTAQVLTSQWFVSRRGWALSLATMGVVASNAVLPPLAHFLIAHIGWRHTYLWVGAVLSALVALLAWLVIRNRPEDLGLHPDGATEPIPDVAASDLVDRGDRNREAGAPRPVWRAALFWSLALPLSVPPFVATAAVFHQVSLFESQGLTAQHSANALSLLAVASAVGTLSAGWLLDRLGVRNTTVLMLVLLAGAMALLTAMNSPALAVLYSLCLGASIGLWAVTNGATWPHYYGRTRLGGVQGSATTVLLTAAAVAPLPVAFLHAGFGSHGPGIAVLLATAVLAALVTATRPRRRTT